jgi:hypothetical protein
LKHTVGHRSGAARLLAEAVVVVGSILLAFSIDAWWDDRGESKAESILLERLQADFPELRSTLQFVEDEHRRASTACEVLLGFPANTELPATAEVDAMIAYVFLHSRTFNPGSGAVASFLSSDDAELIRNERLADLLLTWPGLVEELQEEEANLQKGVAERWTPFLAGRVGLGPYLDTVDLLRTKIPAQIARPEPRQPLIADQEFLNHVLNRYTWQQIALRDIKPLETSVKEILELIAGELDR